ncbi:Cyanamide hydratase [Pleurostoma richardsiae]|uniref:Cyanamide hydratase n=1 Tax=Pleurostoma richardsiae TaxID=41990 RepID=A0AA38RZK5_9PEZI|nr:Cyanamide hydratase [Pleurostoma richardsiae]
MSSSPDLLALHGWNAVVRDPKTLLSGRPYIYKPGPLLARDISFPSDDPVVAKVREFAKGKLAPQTYNHSMRVYYFASAILLQQFPGSALSPSTLALACLLHDIGTTHDNLRATLLSFEFYGGLLALDLVGTQLGAPRPQAEAVAEAIIRHQDLGTTGKITFLGQLVQLATIHDNMGGCPEIVHAATREDVCAAFPRGGWSGCFAATIREENGLKPWAHTTALGEEDFPEGVLNNKLMAEFD